MSSKKKRNAGALQRGQRTASSTEIPAGLKLPDGITVERGPASGGPAYYFRHSKLGELGRVRVVDTGGGQGRLIGEVAGEPNDPSTEQRAALMAPLIHQVHHLFDETAGIPHHPREVKPLGPVAQEDRGGLEIKVLECNKCAAPVARLIFAPPGTSGHADFADVERLTFSICSAMQLPTWIVGPGDVVDILTKDDPMDVQSDVMQVWPVRGELFSMSPKNFNPTLETLQANHCSTSTSD